ncbi:MAG: hypothetical protein QM401_07645 [Bacillota bacterium]|nr:hypothetical protein [Bacillota bacterium]
MCKIRLNRNKNIGRVLFIVEGGRTEFSLLRRIFCDLLQYEYLDEQFQSLIEEYNMRIP